MTVQDSFEPFSCGGSLDFTCKQEPAVACLTAVPIGTPASQWESRGTGDPDPPRRKSKLAPKRACRTDRCWGTHGRVWRGPPQEPWPRFLPCQSHSRPTGVRGAGRIFVDNQGLVESGGQGQGCMSGDAAFRHGRGADHVYGCVAGVGALLASARTRAGSFPKYGQCPRTGRPDEWRVGRIGARDFHGL